MAETKTKVEIDRASALKVTAWCGWKSAGKWPNERMAEKLKQVKEVMPEDADVPEDIKETLGLILKGIEDESDFEVTGEAPKEDKKKDTTPPKAKEKKYPGVEGVRPGKTRAYYAGQVLKESGLEKGITKEMREEVDKRFGTENVDASWSALTATWHGLNGYTGDVEIKE